MSADIRLGVKSKLYINTSGNYASPEWEEAHLVSDLQINATWDEGESTSRISLIKTMEPTMLGLDLAGKIRKKYGNDAWRFMYEKFIAADSLDILVLDGTIAQNQSTGYRFDARVFQFSEDQAMGSVLFNDFTVKPCAGDNGVKAVVVASGTPTYGDIGDTTGTSFTMTSAGDV